MTTIQITAEFQAQLSAIQEQGKTPWVIINEDYAVGAYAGRTQAREAKAAGNLAGKILKADEVQFQVVTLASMAQALHNEATTPVFEQTFSAQQNAADAALDPIPAPKKAKAEPKVNSESSSIERPCKQVWHIADSMPGAKRKDVLAACVEKGIAYNTARTQYQQWFQINSKAK